MAKENEFTTFQNFLTWEKASHEIIKVNTYYVDMAGDLHAGLLLSQIVYWHLPSKNGKPKMRIVKRDSEGNQRAWIAKKRYEWWDEIRLSPKQVDRAIKILKEKELIDVHLYRFKGLTVPHIRIIEENFLKQLNNVVNYPQANPGIPQRVKAEKPSVLPKGQKRNSLKVNSNGIPQRSKPLTETKKTTTKNVGNFLFGYLYENPTTKALEKRLKKEDKLREEYFAYTADFCRDDNGGIDTGKLFNLLNEDKYWPRWCEERDFEARSEKDRANFKDMRALLGD